MICDLRLLNLDKEAELMYGLYGTTGHLVPTVDAIIRGNPEYTNKQEYQINFEYGDVTIQKEAISDT